MRWLAFLFCCTLAAQSPKSLYDRAWRAYEQGRLQESVDLFDELVRVAPGSEPDLWQRGIAQYEAGRFRECRAQFELHRRVNPADVENAAFHFLCVARAEGPEAARAALLPVGPDARVPMKEVYEMLQGNRKPEGVLTAAGSRSDAVFFAHLYVGYYYEAMGEDKKARPHFERAASQEFAAAGGLMHTVAAVHLEQLKKRRTAR
jgi:lipoprotein NlpI